MDLSAKGQLIFRATDEHLRELPEPGDYEALAKIPRNLLAELSYAVTISCTFKRANETKEYPLVVYNALSFIAYATQTPGAPSSGRLQRLGFIAPQLEWIVQREAGIGV
jgi:hypothetical protein